MTKNLFTLNGKMQAMNTDWSWLCWLLMKRGIITIYIRSPVLTEDVIVFLYVFFSCSQSCAKVFLEMTRLICMKFYWFDNILNLIRNRSLFVDNVISKDIACTFSGLVDERLQIRLSIIPVKLRKRWSSIGLGN